MELYSPSREGQLNMTLGGGLKVEMVMRGGLGISLQSLNTMCPTSKSIGTPFSW